jgi:hypothetical protein
MFLPLSMGAWRTGCNASYYGDHDLESNFLPHRYTDPGQAVRSGDDWLRLVPAAQTAIALKATAADGGTLTQKERVMSATLRGNKKPRIKNVMVAEADHVHHPKTVAPATLPPAATIEITPIPKAAVKRRTLWQFLFG